MQIRCMNRFDQHWNFGNIHHNNNMLNARPDETFRLIGKCSGMKGLKELAIP